MRGSGLGRRVPTALVYGVVVLSAVALPPAGLLVWAILAVLAYLEYARLARASPFAGTILVLGLWEAHAGFLPLPVVLGLVVLSLVVLVLESPLTPGGFAAWPRRAGLTLVGALWTGGLLGYLVDLGLAGASRTTAAPGWPVWLLLALALTWTADTVAYAVGSRWGRHTLVPRLSPGKTWEGTLAGFAAAAAVALVFAGVAGLPLPAAIVVAVLGGPAALAGDLAESALKRSAGVKDSGALLPGHGGVFDRIDSLLAVAPVVAFALGVAGWAR